MNAGTISLKLIMFVTTELLSNSMHTGCTQDRTYSTEALEDFLTKIRYLLRSKTLLSILKLVP